jgi:acetyl esterase/lipase
MRSILFSLFIVASLQSQILSLEEIMKGDDFIGHQPSRMQWSSDGSTIYFDWNPSFENESSRFYWKKGMKSPQPLDEQLEFQSRLNFDNQKDFKIKYYLRQGFLFSFDPKTAKHELLFQSSQPITNLQRGKDPNVLFFQMGDNLFQLEISPIRLTKLTNFKSGKSKDKNDTTNFLKEQQLELFEFIRDKETKRNSNEEKSKRTKLSEPKELYYDKSTLEQLTVAPNGAFVTFRLSEYPSSTSTKVEHFITENGYTENKNARPKVSADQFSKHRMGFFNIQLDTIMYVSFESLTGLKNTPLYYQEYEKLKNQETEAKPIVMMPPVFNSTGTKAVMVVRSQDNKDRWILELTLPSGTITEIDHQYDEAWIGGPGISSSNFSSGILGFLKDDETIYFHSEASGYSHLYTYNLKTKVKKQLTHGNWEVREVKLSNDGSNFYITSNQTHPGDRGFYTLHINSGKLIPILTNEGAHEVRLSPDEKNLLVRYSNSNQPWELYWAENQPNSTLQQITFSTSSSYKNYKWKKPEVVTFSAKDGQTVYARLYQPQAQKKNNAAVVFVHGAGYLQNAHRFWSDYHREYMFHNLLTDLGYTVLDIDYRGSDGYGRDVRTGIYRHMGGLDLSDHIDGKNWLVQNYSIDSNRVGIYGGSYGGFITLMALLTEPGAFKAGAALRSVTDWAHYNHGYTSNILNFPETDPEAYRKSSPIYFAENLQDRLLMLHGMVDDNVQFQDIVRLTQRFIELGKKDWDLAVYPVEAHGFRATSSWVDEYRRILNLFNDTLLEHE